MIATFIDSSVPDFYHLRPGKKYLVVAAGDQYYRVVYFGDETVVGSYPRSSFFPSDLQPPSHWEVWHGENGAWEAYMPEVGGEKLIFATDDGDLPSITAARKEFKERAEKVFAELMRAKVEEGQH